MHTKVAALKAEWARRRPWIEQKTRKGKRQAAPFRKPEQPKVKKTRATEDRLASTARG